MRKRRVLDVIVFAVIVSMMLIMTSCGCEHEWQDATCQSPMTCSICGKTEGEIGLHSWIDATCTAPKTCSICNVTEGEQLNHQWREDCKICSVCGLDERTIDEKFMESLAMGLEERWALTEADEEAEVLTKVDWEEYFDAEYNQIITYEDETFENKDLGKWANNYIDSIVQSKEALAYYGTNQWSAKYTNGIYNDRVVALYEIHAINSVPVSEDNQENLLGLLSDGEVINMVNGLFEKVVFEKTDDSYGWKTYEAVVENTTTLNFDSFYFDVDLIDEDGVTVATETAWAENWQSGEKIRFSFSTDEKFEEMEVESASWIF